MKSSPPLKAKLLFDDAYRPQPSPPLSPQSEPLLGGAGVLRIQLPADSAPEARAREPWCARLAVACDELPTPRDVCKALAAPCRSRTGYARRMRHNFGLPFLLMLTSVYLLVKGMLVQIVALSKLPYYKQAGVGPRTYQQYDIVTKTPWALKAFFGGLSDLLPLCGYPKQAYMSAVAVIGGACCALLALGANLPPGALGGSAFLASVPATTLCFFGVNLQAAVTDLLAEGRYTAAMAAAPWSGADLVSLVWGCVQAGSFLSAALVGWAADSGRLQLLFPLAAFLSLQVLPLSQAGFLGDVRLPPGERGLQRHKLAANPRLFALAGLMALCSLGIGGLNLANARPALLLAASLGASALLCGLAFWALPRTLAKANLYLYLASVLYVQISGAVDYFYTAGPECVPGGPSFSFRYYITYSAIVQAAFGYCGVLLFHACLRRSTFRAVLAATALLQVAAGAVDLVIVLRWNVTVLGVPDSLAFMLGYNVVFQIAAMLNFMPTVILTSKLCPPQVEATMFALLAGFQNFGSMVAGSLGVVLIQALGIRAGPAPDGAHVGGDAASAALAAASDGGVPLCDFSNLPYAIVLSHMLLPLLCVPLGYALLPDARLNDKINLDDADAPRAKPADDLPVEAQARAQARGEGAGGRGGRGQVQPRAAERGPPLERAASER